MRRGMLLALLALALPTAALTTSVSTHSSAVPCFDFPGGTFERGTVHASFTTMLHTPVVASDDPISLETGTLTMMPPECGPRNSGVICFRLSSGTVTVKNPAGDAVLTDWLKGGFMSTVNDRVNLSAPLVPNNTVSIGNAHFAIEFNHHTMTAGDAPVFGINVPSILEPGTLRLLGTDPIGLAGMARRLKLRR